MPAKILLVENSTADLKKLELALCKYNLLIARSGAEAAKQIDLHADIELVILSLDMPEDDSSILLQHLGADDRYGGLSIIITTNQSEPRNDLRLPKHGVSGFLRKPFEMSELAASAEAHLEFCRLRQIANHKLLDRDITFEALFYEAPIGIVISHDYQFIDHSGMKDGDRLLMINPCYEKITGRSKEELARLGWEKITHPDDLEADRSNYKKLLSREINSYSIEKRYIKPDNSIVWVQMTIASISFITSDRNYICLVQDITRQKNIETILRDSERSKAVLLDNLPGMMYQCVFDRKWTMQYISNGCFDLTGYRPASFLYNKDIAFSDIILPKYQEILWNQWELVIRDHKKLIAEYEIITASGEIKWVWEQGQGIYDADGKVLWLEGLILDITDRKKDEMKLKYLSEHDQLTGLHNLHSFEQTYSNYRLADETAKCAVIMVNVRSFSKVNSVLGYHFAQKLILDIAACLEKAAHPGCLPFHVGIDRFVLFIKEYGATQDLFDLCDKIINSLDEKIAQKTVNFNLGLLEIPCSASIDAENILQKADMAAEQVRSNSRFSICCYNKEMADRQHWENTIRFALSETLNAADDSLFMLYQPIVCLKTNKISGFEALARYKHKELGLVSPVEFIPIAESSQLMRPMGKRLMLIAFTFAYRLSREWAEPIKLSFNVSAIQLLSDPFLPELEALIDLTGVNPANLNIEITESIFSDNYQKINEILGKIKKMGIQVTIDDFGTGYSSLARERELNVDGLKIDKYFIDKLVDVKPEVEITGDIISMAHKMGHYVVAEGVEFETQRQYLSEHGCDMMQGYYFSKPIDEESAISLLKITNAD